VAIYVDDYRQPAEVQNGERIFHGRWSHLMADSHEELMAAAERLGLRPEWLQHAGTRREHFDVLLGKRAKAIGIGAQEISYPRGVAELLDRKRLAEEREQCTMADPCQQEECGACYPDEVMQRETEEREVEEAERQEPQSQVTQDEIQRAHDLDLAAGQAYRAGDFSRALNILGEARVLAPGMSEVLSNHMARVREAQRQAVKEVSEPRDAGQLADTFGERLGPQERFLAERDANRGEPKEKCDTPKGGGECGEPAHLYAQGRRCDLHRPKVLADKERGQ